MNVRHSAAVYATRTKRVNRRAPSAPARRASVVQVIRLEPALLAWLTETAPDPSRVVIESPTSLLILNHPRTAATRRNHR